MFNFLKKYLWDCTLGFIALLLVVTSCFFQISYIPTSSMARTLLPGDIVFVNKMKYHLNSIRIPIINYEIPIWKSGIISWNEPKHGDIITFVPDFTSSYYLKRLIAKPGDVLFLKNKNLFISFADSDTEKFFEENNVDSIELKGKRFFSNPYKFFEKNIFYKDLEKNKDSSLVLKDEKGDLYLKNGEKFLDLSLKNDEAYNIILKQVKNKDKAINDAKLFAKLKINFPVNVENIQDNGVYTMVVPEDKYFVMGDNRDNSYDSRFFGFINKSNITGSPFFVLLSTYNDDWLEDERTFRLNKSFKVINNELSNFKPSSKEVNNVDNSSTIETNLTNEELTEIIKNQSNKEK